MVKNHSRSHVVVVAITLVCTLAAPAAMHAQESQEEAVRKLEKKAEELAKEAETLRREIERLKGNVPGETPSERAVDDLTQVEVEQADPAVAEDVQPVVNEAPPPTSRVFNPDIAVVGTFLGHAGDSNPFESGPDETRGPFDLGEVELSLEAFIDPYARGRFFLAVGEEGVEVEEGYAEFLTLPWDLSAKAGKKKALFGKANTFHTHVRPWIDQPLVIHNLFGDEGLADVGVSVSKMLPSRAFFTELTAEVFSGAAEGIFERQNQNDLFYNTHLRFFRDLNENSNLEVGTSYARGTGAASGTASEFTGVDLSYRWKPLQQGGYRGFIARFEAMRNAVSGREQDLTGFYASAEWRLAQRWLAGLRLDRAHREGEERRFSDRGESLLLTFRMSEFSLVRGQLRRISYGGERTVNEFLIQLQFAIGAHGAHQF